MNTIKFRFRSHFFHITHKPTTTVAHHFITSDHHGLDDVRIFILSFINIPSKHPHARGKRLQEEALWQHRLHTLAPHGLNTLDENRIM
jgi:hypothetical protein